MVFIAQKFSFGLELRHFILHLIEYDVEGGEACQILVKDILYFCPIRVNLGDR